MLSAGIQAYLYSKLISLLRALHSFYNNKIDQQTNPDKSIPNETGSIKGRNCPKIRLKAYLALHWCHKCSSMPLAGHLIILRYFKKCENI